MIGSVTPSISYVGMSIHTILWSDMARLPCL